MSSCVLCGGYSHHVGPGRHLLQWRQLLKISGFSTARSYLLAWALRTLRILACPFERVDGPAFSTQCRQSEPRGASVPSLWLQQPGVARRPAGHGSPTGTLRFSQQTRPYYRPNSRGLAPGTTLTGPCPAALRAPTCRLQSSPFLAPKRHQPDAICRKSQARVRAGARKVAGGGLPPRGYIPHRYG